MLAAVGHQHLAGCTRSRSRERSWRRSPRAARGGRRPACSGGSAGRGTPRRRPRRCAPASGSRARRHRSRSRSRPAAFSAFALASTASVADSAMAAMRRSETRLRARQAAGISSHGDRGRRVSAATDPTITDPCATCCRATGASVRARPRSGPRRSRRLAEAAPVPRHRHRQATGAGSSSARCATGSPSCSTLPDGYEIVLGNGGTTAFWDAAAFGLDRTAQPAPVLRRVLVEVRRRGRGCAIPRRTVDHRVRARARTRSRWPSSDVDAYCLTHNETSTGVAMRLRRPAGAATALVLVDATSAAGGLRVRCGARSTCTTSRRRRTSARDGGLWIAAMSPAAVERIERIAATSVGFPAFIDLPIAIDNCRQGPDLQHAGARDDLPARRTGRVDQRQRRTANGRRALRPVRRASSTGGPRRRAARRRSSPTRRSARHVVGTIDLDASRRRRPPSRPCCGATASSTPMRTASSAATSCASAMFPAIDPDDVDGAHQLHRLRRRTFELIWSQ